MVGMLPNLKPAGPKPEWGPDITDNMQVIIEKLGSMGGKPIETLSAKEARMQPSPADAVKAVMQENNIPMPEPKCDTMGKEIPVNGGTVHARIYMPKDEKGPLPVIVYFHGGGWVIANIDTYDASASSICGQTKAIVVSVNYRQGPEHKFPTAHNDCFAAYQWVLKNASSMNGDAKKVAVMGESAGGNLAIGVSMMARDKGIQMPVYQALVYPIANDDTNSESYRKNVNAKPLNKAMMIWFYKNYLPNMSMSSNPLVSPVKANLKGLPPTTIITDELDPLMTEGQLLAQKLKDAGVKVNAKNYDGVTHEFFGMATLLKEAKDAQGVVADDLKDAFNK
ncbi:MAG: alpha/beta hydrolase [Sphingobacteriales bacterium]|nr:MAG: alpha/beta hydrolase [Sphingobacteriales bacterium]